MDSMLSNIVPIREYYPGPDKKIKSETYLIHMIYVIYQYDEDGEIISLTVNGKEYPTKANLVFDEEHNCLTIT